MIRLLKAYRDYFWKFYHALPESVKEKIDYVFEIMLISDQVPKKFFKHLENGIYEIRVERGGNIYRIFCFFDKNSLVILLHGIQKRG
ncbi:MAG: type II toxin-antitoxin system RelE/ParE family toxin [Bacteroidetes bacterium]|nr:MAG: type II toxin-antitoxin system RelE/ParE family toxin [Bacteroidota bacterium]